MSSTQLAKKIVTIGIYRYSQLFIGLGNNFDNENKLRNLQNEMNGLVSLSQGCTILI